MKNSYRVQDIDAYSFTVHEGEKTESVAHVFLARSSSSNKIRVDDMRFTISSPRGSFGNDEVQIWVKKTQLDELQDHVNGVCAAITKHLEELNAR